MASVERFSHNNPADLREVASTVNGTSPKMLVLEGVYSMEGHISRLPEIIDIAEEYGCFSVLDDAHVLAYWVVRDEDGRSFRLERQGRRHRGSMSKSLASTGGFVAASREVIEYLRTNSKQTIFSAALSPAKPPVRWLRLS